MAIKRLEEKHRKLAEEILKGTPRITIADMLNVTRSTIYVWMTDPLWRAYFAKLAEDVESARQQRLLPVAMKAADAAEQALQNTIELLVAKDKNAPSLSTVIDALKKVVELERVDRGQPSNITRADKGKGDEPQQPLSPMAQKLLQSLDDMVKAEDGAGAHLVEPETKGQPN